MDNENKIKKTFEKVVESTTKFVDEATPKVKEFVSDAKEYATNTAAPAIKEATIKASKKTKELIDDVKEKNDKEKDEKERKKFKPFDSTMLDDDIRMIIIGEKDKKRAESHVCDHSIGHYDYVKNGLKVAVIYKKYVCMFKYEFYPNADYGFYYMSPVNRNKYIRLDNYFEYIKDQRVSELHDIAYKIGASFVQVSYKEELKTLVSNSFNFSGKTKANDADVKAALSISNNDKNYTDLSILDSAHYQDNKPTRPELYYFTEDEKIKQLIEAALQGQVEDRHINIKYNTSMFMKKETAIKIDATLKQYNASGNGSITSEVENELRTELDFYVEFRK